MAKIIDCSKVRGFNYHPSYAAHGLDIWLHYFNADTIARELSLAKKYFPGMNTIRLWLSWDAFLADPAKFVSNFESVLNILHSLDLRAVVTLFNGWHSVPDFGGISPEQTRYWSDNPVVCAPYHTPYLEQIVGRFAGDERILIWDLCNEPFDSGGQEYTSKWLANIGERIREMDSQTPICVSCCGLSDLELMEPICDILAIHPYFMWSDEDWDVGSSTLSAFIDGCVKFAEKVHKPLLATETGWGSLDDARRARTLRLELGEITKRNLGFMVHLLHHTLVADGHRPEYGFVSTAGYMAMIEPDGSLRPHHEVFNEF